MDQKTNYERAQELASKAADHEMSFTERAQVHATLALCDHLHQVTVYLDKIYEALPNPLDREE